MPNDAGQSTPAPSIPVHHIRAAAKDADLKLLLRQVETAARRVARALEAEAEAKGAVADYVATKYASADLAVALGVALEPA